MRSGSCAPWWTSGAALIGSMETPKAELDNIQDVNWSLLSHDNERKEQSSRQGHIHRPTSGRGNWIKGDDTVYSPQCTLHLLLRTTHITQVSQTQFSQAQHDYLPIARRPQSSRTTGTRAQSQTEAVVGLLNLSSLVLPVSVIA